MRKYLSYILVCFLAVTARAQQGLDFAYDFCTDTDRVVSGAFSSYADSNFFLVTGVTNTMNVSPEHSYLASFDYQGNILWSKKLLFPGFYNSSQSYKGIVKLRDNKYMFLGAIYKNASHGVGYSYFYFFDKNGDSLYYRAYPDTADRRYISSAVIDRNSIVAAGGVFYNKQNSCAVWISKYDTLGNKIWEKDFPQSQLYPEDLNVIISADNRHYLFAGEMYLDGKVCSGMRKTDTAGNLIWAKPLAKKPWSSYRYMDVVTNPGGGYYFVSSISLSASWAPDSSFIYYGKLNEDGDIVWARTFRENFNNCMGYQIKWDNDKRHLVMLTGPATGTLSGFMKIDTLGNVQWYSIPKHQMPSIPYFRWGGILHNINVTPDNKYLMTGYTVDSVGNNLSWIVLADSNGMRYPNDRDMQPLYIKMMVGGNGVDVNVYPNPFNSQLTVSCSQFAISNIQLIDIYGRIVHTQKLTAEKTTINTASLTAGNYMLVLTGADGERVVRKVVKTE